MADTTAAPSGSAELEPPEKILTEDSVHSRGPEDSQISQNGSDQQAENVDKEATASLRLDPEETLREKRRKVQSSRRESFSNANSQEPGNNTLVPGRSETELSQAISTPSFLQDSISEGGGARRRVKSRIPAGSSAAAFDSIRFSADSSLAVAGPADEPDASQLAAAPRQQSVSSPSFLQDSISVSRMSRGRNRKNYTDTAAAFDSIEVPSENGSVARAESDEQLGQEGPDQLQNITIPSFLQDSASEETVLRCKGRIQMGNDTVARAFDSIQVPPADDQSLVSSQSETQTSQVGHRQPQGSQKGNKTAAATDSSFLPAGNRTADPEHSRTVTSQEGSFQSQKIATPSFLQESPSEGGRHRAKSRFQTGNNTAAAFDSIQVPTENTATVSSHSQSRLTEGGSSQPQVIATPSFLNDSASEGRKLRARSRIPRANITAAAAFDSIQVPLENNNTFIPSQSYTQLSQGASSSQPESVATPSFLQDSSSEVGRPRVKRRMPMGGNLTAANAFDR